jgi:hypothetical protein
MSELRLNDYGRECYNAGRASTAAEVARLQAELDGLKGTRHVSHALIINNGPDVLTCPVCKSTVYAHGVHQCTMPVL